MKTLRFTQLFVAAVNIARVNNGIILLVGMYSKEELNRLWIHLANYYVSDLAQAPSGVTLVLGSPPIKATGLREVPFHISMKKFRKAYSFKMNLYHSHRCWEITDDIDYAIGLFKPGEVDLIHKSCATDYTRRTNSALCIHYDRGKKGFAVAIPGIVAVKNPDYEKWRKMRGMLIASKSQRVSSLPSELSEILRHAK